MLSKLRVKGVPFVESAVDAALAGDTPPKFYWLEFIWMIGLFAGGILVS